MASKRLLSLARLAAYVPPLLFLFFAGISPFFPTILNGMSVQVLLALMAAALLGVGFHLETRFSEEMKGMPGLKQAVSDLAREQAQRLATVGRPIRPMSLADAFRTRANIETRVDTLRVFAISSAQIVSFLQSHPVQISRCCLLLRAFEEGDSVHRDFVSQIFLAIRDWQRLVREGRIESLVVRSYDFFPTEYQVVFDEKQMIAGLYESDTKDYSGVKVQSPIYVDGSTSDGTMMIAAYIRRFDRLFEDCAVNYGPDRYAEFSISHHRG